MATKAEPKKAEKRKSIISKSAIVKLAKKNGAERIGKDAAIKMIEETEKFVADLTQEAMAAAAHANRKSIRADDIDFVCQ